MNYLKIAYHIAAAIAFVTVINDVLILRWHRWDRHLFNLLPLGEWIGWFEIMFFGTMTCLAAWFVIQEIKEASKI